MMRLALVMVLAAQVGVIIQSAEPDRAERLLVRAKDIARQVKSVEKQGTLNANGRAKVEASARSLMTEAKAIREDARRGVALSLNEQDQLDRALAGVRKICDWLLKRSVMPSARPAAAGTSPAPSPAPSPAALKPSPSGSR